MTPVDPQLAFETSRGRYGVPAERVRQVVWLPLLDETDGEGRGRIGMADLQGAPVPVVDLDLVLGQRPEPYSLDHRLVDVQARGGRLGLVAAKVLDVLYMDEEDLVQSPGEGGLIQATARIEDGLIELLEVDRLAGLPPSSREPDVGAEELFASFDEDQLEELSRRQRRLATEEAVPEAEPERSAVLADLGAETVAIPLEAVDAFIQLGRLTPVPHAPEHVLGLTNHRGEVVTVVDPHGPLSLERPSGLVPKLAVVVAFPEGLTAIAIEGAGRTVTFDDEDVDTEAAAPGVRGQLAHQEGSLQLVDPFALLRTEAAVVDQEARAP